MINSGFRYLDLEKIFMYKDDDFAYPLISFEQSAQGMWLSLKRFNEFNEFNECLKEIIALAFNCGFKWEDGDGEVEFDKRVTSLEDLNDDVSIDSLFNEALEYLNEWAFNDDPGWLLTFDRDGLRMQSMWSDDSDIWDESREERSSALSFGSDAVRKMLQNEN